MQKEVCEGQKVFSRVERLVVAGKVFTVLIVLNLPPPLRKLLPPASSVQGVFAYLRGVQVGKHISGVFGAQVGKHTLNVFAYLRANCTKN